MKVKFEYKMINNIWFIISFVIAVVCWYASRYPVVIVPAFGIAYYFLKTIKIDVNKKFAWPVTGLILLLSPCLSVFCIQLLLTHIEMLSDLKMYKWILNICIALVFYLIIQACTNNVGLTVVICHILLVLLGFIDYYVYMFRQNEFIFADLKSIGTGLSVAGNYDFSLSKIGGMIIVLAMLYIAFVRSIRIEADSRIINAIVTILVAILAVIYIIYRSMNIDTQTWLKRGAEKNGYLLNYVLGVRDSFVRPPEGYSASVIEELENTYDSSDDTRSEETKTPTIIAIMSESYSDLSVIGDLETNIDVTPYYDSLKENITKGYALSSVFGAKTPNSEWEFMTGNSMAFLPTGSVAYQQYMNKTPSSIVSNLKEAGYTCVAMHPYVNTGWSRNIVYPRLGFDETYFLDDFDQEDTCRGFVADQEFYNKIIARYEDSPSKENLFIMGISMQNHGGYVEYFADSPDDVYKTGDSYTDANLYLSLIHKSDQALSTLIEYFENVDDPVEIVFFGDHQPSLTKNFYKILNGKGMSGLSVNELESFYTVPFFIWTNYESDEEEVQITSLNYLSTLALEKAGIELPAYNEFLSDAMEVVPAINSRGYYSLTDGEYKKIEDATGEEKKWIDLYQALQYNGMFDKKNRSDVFFPYSISQ